MSSCCKGWLKAGDPKPRDSMSDDRLALEHLFQTSTPGIALVLRHYLYLPTENDAAAVAKNLRDQGFQTTEWLGADGGNWLGVAKHVGVSGGGPIGGRPPTWRALTHGRCWEYLV